MLEDTPERQEICNIQRSNSSVSLPTIGSSYFNEINISNSVGVHFGTKIYHVHFNESANQYISNTDITNINIPAEVELRAADSNITSNENGNQIPNEKFHLSLIGLWNSYKVYIILLSVIILSVTAVVIYFITRAKQNDKKDQNDIVIHGEELQERIVQRSEWRAMKPTITKNLKTPTGIVVICHTATVICRTRNTCTIAVQSYQSNHIESRHYDDISYNFLIGGEGSVYVGRGWDVVGQFVDSPYDEKSIGISLIGNFMTDHPTQTQLNGIKLLIEEGIFQNKITDDYKLMARTNLSSSQQSPGKYVYDEIKNWEHFSETPD